jgi:hypothetical protein
MSSNEKNMNFGVRLCSQNQGKEVKGSTHEDQVIDVDTEN